MLTLNVISQHVQCMLQFWIKIQPDIIVKEGDVFIFYNIVLIDVMDFKNAIWRLICTIT